MSHVRPPAAAPNARQARSHSTPASTRPRGRSRVRRNTFDLDTPEGQVHSPLGETFEESDIVRQALIETATVIQARTAEAVRYGQGVITRVARDALKTLLSPAEGFDHWSGTNDLAGSQIASAGGFSKRHWQRVKPVLEGLGLVSYIHRSIKTGLPDAAGVDRDLPISDLYFFSPANLVPWVREIYDEVKRRIETRDAARRRREGVTRKRTPLVKRDRPHRRIPALLNPVGWARAVAASHKAVASPAAAYAAEEARAIAFAAKLALSPSPG